MGNPYGAPEMTVDELADVRSRGGCWVLDVREPFEWELAALSGVDVLLVPLSDLSQRGLAALPDEVKDRQTSIAVLCHHGIRSAQVTQWLLAQGWKDVRSVEGGLDLYAQKIDSSVGAYE